MSRPVPRLAIETDHELLDGYARFCAALGLCDGGLRDRLEEDWNTVTILAALLTPPSTR